MTRKKAILTIIISSLGVLLGFVVFRGIRYVRYRNLPIAQFKDLIGDIADTIIPRTNTPGAKDANVSQYIVNVIENCTSLVDKRIFISGLKAVENYSMNRYSSAFSELNDLNKVLVLQHFENKGSFSNPLLNKIKRKLLGGSFFEQMKWLAVSGYCRSQLGATQGLAYDHIPIDYLSCIPYSPNQKSWATK